MVDCIKEIDEMVELPPLPVADEASVKECVICIDAPRGYIRFMPCQHSVCCRDCSDMLMARGDAMCPICDQRIGSLQQGHFPHTFQGGP